jgi:hypothetical protein
MRDRQIELEIDKKKQRERERERERERKKERERDREFLDCQDVLFQTVENFLTVKMSLLKMLRIS